MNTTLQEMTSAVAGAVGNFREHRLFFVRLTKFAADPFDPYPMGVDGGTRPGERFGQLLQEARQRRAHVIRLRYLPRAVLFGDGAPALPAGSRLHAHSVSCVSLDEPWSVSSLSRVSRKSLKRSARALKALDAVRFDEVRDLAGRGRACERLLAWKRSWLRRRFKVAPGFHDPVFQNSVAAQFGEGDPDTYRVFALRLGDEPIAYEFCVRSGSRLLSLIASFDKDYARYGPGRLLTAYILENARAMEVDVYDMLPPETAFKKSFANRSEEFYELVVPLTRLGRAIVWLAGKAGKL